MSKLIACASMALVLSTGQPQDGGEPVLIYTTMDRAPGVPWSGHVMLPAQNGIILGCWTDKGYPVSYLDTHGCYWVVSSRELHNLEPVDIEGITYYPRMPYPGVDAATGATIWEFRSAGGLTEKVTVIIPGVVRSADFNGDGGVPNTQDITAFLNAWNEQRE